MDKQTGQSNNALSANWGYRRQGFANLLRMGHCAPTAMRTILDVSSLDEEWLVKLAAGMPGGIGNTGHECGAFTSPLALLGIQYGLAEGDGGLPLIFDKGQALYQSFLTCHMTLQCKEIRGKDRFPAHCIPPVLHSPEHYMHALNGDHDGVIPTDQRAAYARMYAHLVEGEFHCAKAVFTHLGYTPSESWELFDALSGFTGGTLLMGKTCSAFAAGVMAAGLRAGEIEDSIPRVVRLLYIMTVGGNAFKDDLNKFNKSMNYGYRLSRWFAKRFGSTQCGAITGCDFSTMEGVSRYIESDQISRCRELANMVSKKVRSEVQDAVHV